MTDQRIPGGVGDGQLAPLAPEPEPVATPEWRDAVVVGAVRVGDGLLAGRWIVRCADGREHRIVAVEVEADWTTPVLEAVS